MSNYPDDMASPRQVDIQYQCNDCRHKFIVDCVRDCGDIQPYNEDDTICPGCDSSDTEAL